MPLRYAYGTTWPLVAVLVLDAAWWLAWFGIMLWFMIDTAIGETARLAFRYTALHGLLGASLLITLDRAHDHERVSVSGLVWVVFAAFVDLYSVLESFLHLSGLSAQEVRACQGVALSALILTALGALAYVVLLQSERRFNKRDAY